MFIEDHVENHDENGSSFTDDFSAHDGADHDALDHTALDHSDLIGETHVADAVPGHHTDPAGTTTVADGDLVVMSPDGTEIDLGEPNLSYSGDGLDSVGVEGSDGTVEVYTDADHDGDVDQALRIDPDGSFTAWTTDGDGHWTAYATGHVDSAGHAVVDETIDPAAVGTQPAVASVAADEPDADTFPGVADGDIAVAADGHYVDAGPARYDLDGDGRAETAVVQSDGRIIQVSDTDGDGRADEMLQVDTSTHQAAILTDDGSGNWQVAATGHIDGGGQFVEDQTSTGTQTHAPDIVYTSADGTRTDLGAPNEDLDGDGVAESVAVRTDDGDVLVVSDTNGDGHPDQMIQVDSHTGEATWAVPDGHGGWDVVQSGHLSSDGSLVVDHAVSDDTKNDQDTKNEQDTKNDHEIKNDHETTNDQESNHDENMEVGVAGKSFDAGPATIDTDGDGVPDTVSVAGPAGSTLFYQDTDGDGIADKAWSTDSGGHVTANYTLGSGGDWSAVQVGAKA